MKRINTMFWMNAALFFASGCVLYLNTTFYTYFLLWQNWYAFLYAEVYVGGVTETMYYLSSFGIIMLSIYLPAVIYAISASYLSRKAEKKWIPAILFVGVLPVYLLIKIAVTAGLADPAGIHLGDATVLLSMLFFSAVSWFVSKYFIDEKALTDLKKSKIDVFKCTLAVAAVLVMMMLVAFADSFDRSTTLMPTGDFFFGYVLGMVIYCSYRARKLGVGKNMLVYLSAVIVLAVYLIINAFVLKERGMYGVADNGAPKLLFSLLLFGIISVASLCSPAFEGVNRLIKKNK